MVFNDPNLNETGRINLGDFQALQANPSKILDANGQSVSSGPPIGHPVEELAEKIFRGGGVSWHLDDEATKKAGKDMFFPRLAVKGIAEKFGLSRPHKDFFPEERNLLLTAFMNDIGLYLFNVLPFREIHTKNGVAFRPNPEWTRLPVHKS